MIRHDSVFDLSTGSGLHRALVALDGSDFAWRALSAAIAHSRDVPNTVLHLLTVHSASCMAEESDSWRERDRTRRMAAMRTDWVLRQSEQRIPADGPQYTKEVLEGEPATVISQRARQLKCEIIFVGAQGSGGTHGGTIGSVAARLIAVSVVPVRVIK